MDKPARVVFYSALFAGVAMGVLVGFATQSAATGAVYGIGAALFTGIIGWLVARR